MNLLRERLTEIMDRERANRNSIHLYCTGPYWVAFERSAYQLHRAFPDSETTPLRLFAYPFPIVMVSVTDRSLRSYTRKHILRRDGSDYKLLTVPGFPLADYRRGGGIAPVKRELDKGRKETVGSPGWQWPSLAARRPLGFGR